MIKKQTNKNKHTDKDERLSILNNIVCCRLLKGKKTSACSEKNGWKARKIIKDGSCKQTKKEI